MSGKKLQNRRRLTVVIIVPAMIKPKVEIGVECERKEKG